MGIFKKPRFLIIGGSVLLAVILLAAALFFLLQPKTIGFYGLDRESEETARLQALLEDAGYAVYYAEDLQDLKNDRCKAWVIHTTSDIFAEKILETIGNKAIFIDGKPPLSQPIRYAGWDMAEAGKVLAELISQLPSQGDTNEDGTVSCILLTGPNGNWDGQRWQQSLQTEMDKLQLPYDILKVLPCSFTEQAGMQTTIDCLSAYGRDIEVILASNEVLAEGAVKAIFQGGWSVNEDFYLLSNSHTDLSQKATQNRQRSGLVVSRQEDYDDALLSAIADVLDGKAPQDYFVPLTSVSNTSPLQ